MRNRDLTDKFKRAKPILFGTQAELSEMPSPQPTVPSFTPQSDGSGKERNPTLRKLAASLNSSRPSDQEPDLTCPAGEEAQKRILERRRPGFPVQQGPVAREPFDVDSSRRAAVRRDEREQKDLDRRIKELNDTIVAEEKAAGPPWWLAVLILVFGGLLLWAVAELALAVWGAVTP